MLLDKLMIWAQVKFLSPITWKKILRENGVLKPDVFSEEKLDEISLKIYNETFKESEKNALIEIEGLGKTYENGFKAVHNFNLRIEPHDFVSLLGPSGCGKTTILRMMAGLEYITEGDYRMKGLKINATHPSERKTAMVFQNYALYPFMTVYGNIAFGLKLKTFKNEITRNRMTKLHQLSMPLIDQIKDVQQEIYDLKNEGDAKLRDLQIKYKKMVTRGKEVNHSESVGKLSSPSNSASIENMTVEQIEAEVEKAKLFKKEAPVRNASQILELQDKVTQLKVEQKEIVAKNNEELKATKADILSQISELKTKEVEYFEKRRNDIPGIKEEIKELKIANAQASKEKMQKINEMAKAMKSAAKTSDDPDAIKKLIDQLKEETFELDKKMHSIGEEISHAVSMIKTIKNSKKFEIDALKSKIKGRSQLRREVVKAAVIWKQTIPSKVRELATLVGIRDYLKRKPAALSGGQRQRVALIRAISKDAQLFLFDEPLSNLDAKLRGTMRSEIRKIHERVQSTSLYVTHDQIEAMTMATKVVIMNVGYIQQVGAPKDLYDNPSNLFVARFIGTPTINTFTGTYKSGVFKSPALTTNVELETEKMDRLSKATKGKSTVVAAIRPQNISVTKVSKLPAGVFGGTVEAIELIGSEAVVMVKPTSGPLLRAIMPAHMDVVIGDTVSLKIDKTRIHIFDSKNGYSLSSHINEETKRALKIWDDSAEERIDNLKILSNERKDKKTIAQLAGREIISIFNKDAKLKYAEEKHSESNKEFKDYNTVQTDEDESIMS